MKSTNHTQRWLKRIKIKNFQSHQDTELELVNGINIITGLEDSGKTALLRAVNWIRTNRPSGIDNWKFNKDKSLTIAGELEFADGVTIIHEKDKGSSCYQVHNPKAGPLEPGSQLFTKVGTNVPEPIAEMLQLEEINIQEQFDQPYLIWLTSGELANVFNRLSGMQRFDDWQVSVSSGVRSANSEIRKNAVDIIAAKEQLDRYSELPVVDKLLKEIIEFDKKISATGKAFDRLRTIYASIKLAQTQLASSTATEEECNNASQLAAEIRECDKKIDSIVVQLDSLTNVSKLFMFIGTAEVELYSSQADYLELLGKAGICDRCYGEIDSAAIDRIKERMQNE